MHEKALFEDFEWQTNEAVLCDVYFEVVHVISMNAVIRYRGITLLPKT